MLNAALKSMLDTTVLVSRPTDTPPGDGQTLSTRALSTPVAVKMRIDSIGGRRNRLAEGVRYKATHLAFADGDASIREGDVLKATTGPYSGTFWTVIEPPNAVHGSHFEIVLETTKLIAAEAAVFT